MINNKNYSNKIRLALKGKLIIEFQSNNPEKYLNEIRKKYPNIEIIKYWEVNKTN